MQHSRIATAALFILAVMLSGCHSAYNKHFTYTPGVTEDFIASSRAYPPPQNPLIERRAAGDPNKILEAYLKRGYTMIGSSIFTSESRESEEAALEQGREVGADLVLVFNPQYAGSTTTNMPISTPTTSTSYATGTATGFGSGGMGSAFGSSTTTTYGTQTTYIPITTHMYNHGAIYFVRQRYSFGAIMRDLNESERQELQKNQGAAIDVVVDGTPAFRENFLVNDIILKVNNNDVISAQSLSMYFNENPGAKMTLTISRKGQTIEKIVVLNN